MRDPAQTDRIIDLLRVLLHAYPYQRLGQLVLVTVAEGETRDLWIVDDDDAERALERALAPRTAGVDQVDAGGNLIDLELERARRRRDP